MHISRRDFLNYGSGLALFAAMPTYVTAANNKSWLFSACSIKQQNFIFAMDLINKKSLFFEVSSRFHDITANDDYAVFIARRPGAVIKIMCLDTQSIIMTLRPGKNRHFFGHAIFSSDNRKLYATESIYAADNLSAKGIIGVYDVQQAFRKIKEIDLDSFGPHQLTLVSGRQIIAVAIGGIHTHPRQKRKKLNKDSFESSLIYIDENNFSIINKIPCEIPQLSLRHLCVDNRGKHSSIIISGQYEGYDTAPPLLYEHDVFQGKKLMPFESELPIWSMHEGYIGSVAIDHIGQKILASSSRGDLISVWDLTSRQLLKTIYLKDVSGVSFSKHFTQFVISNGLGEMYRLDPKKYELSLLQRKAHLQWDNHLMTV